MKIYYLLFTLLLSPSAWSFHEFHLSKCEIAFISEEQAIQIAMHIFIDDLEEELKNKGTSDLFICSDKESPKAEEEIYSYLKEKFEIIADGETLEYQLLGKEPSEDLQAVWCYLEILNVPELKELKVRNEILTQTFDDQKNIVSVSSTQGKKGYFLFDNKHFEEAISF